MKKGIVIQSCIYLIITISCFSQSNIEDIREIESKTKYVSGYSNDFKEEVYLGITFGKVITSLDTTYHINLQIDAPETDFRTDIKIQKSSTAKVIAANGQIVDLELADVKSLIDNDKRTVDPKAQIEVHDHTTTLLLNVSRRKLHEIANEPFYSLVLPYFNSTLKASSEIIFTKPTLFVSRDFIRKYVSSILDL